MRTASNGRSAKRLALMSASDIVIAATSARIGTYKVGFDFIRFDEIALKGDNGT